MRFKQWLQEGPARANDDSGGGALVVARARSARTMRMRCAPFCVNGGGMGRYFPEAERASSPVVILRSEAGLSPRKKRAEPSYPVRSGRWARRYECFGMCARARTPCAHAPSRGHLGEARGDNEVRRPAGAEACAGSVATSAGRPAHGGHICQRAVRATRFCARSFFRTRRAIRASPPPLPP